VPRGGTARRSAARERDGAANGRGGGVWMCGWKERVGEGGGGGGGAWPPAAVGGFVFFEARRSVRRGLDFGGEWTVE